MSYWNPNGLDRFGQCRKHRHGLLRVCGLRERRTTAFADVGQERELRYDEHRSPGISDAHVHLPIGVREYPQGGDLRSSNAGILVGVSRGHADERQQPRLYRSGCCSVDVDGGPGNSLKDDPHPLSRSIPRRTVHRSRRPTPTLAAMLREIPWSIIRGYLMGAADIVPGVSGGTVALVLGIYERLIASVRAGSSALGSFLRLDFTAGMGWLKKIEWSFIVPLGGGIGLAILSLSHLLERLLRDHAVLMAALFLGLVAGSALIVWRLLTARDIRTIAIIVTVTVVVFVLLGLRENTSSESAAQIADPALWAFFLAGSVAICAMILPGISGSFILVMLGMYGPVLSAVTDRGLTSLAVFAIGAVIGLALFSQILHRALRDHYNPVMAALIGLMLGSLRVLWPWPRGVDSTALEAPNGDVIAATAVAVFAFAVVMGIDALGRRIAHQTRQDEVGELTSD